MESVHVRELLKLAKNLPKCPVPLITLIHKGLKVCSSIIKHQLLIEEDILALRCSILHDS